MYTEQLTQALSIPSNPTHAAAQTASFNSGSVDLQKFRRALFIIDIGAVSGTSPTFDAKLQESTDNSSFSDLSGSNVSISQITTASHTVTLEVRAGQITKRYVRVAVTIGGTSPSFTCCVIPIGGEAVEKPGNANDAAQVDQRKVVA
jgi:hypothetical protein